MAYIGTNMNPEVKLDDREENQETHTNLWLNMLSEVQEHSKHKLPSYKTVLVLGDSESGKSSLISKLKGNEHPHSLGFKGSGLEYHCIYVNNDYLEDHSRLNVYILDGDLYGHHRNLLKYVINEETFPHTMVLLTASMAKPYSILESLKSWAQILEEHIERQRIPEHVMEEHRSRVLKRYEDYIEPGSEVESVTSPLRPSNMGEPLCTGKHIKNNLGLEVIVVITKTDYISTLEKDCEMRDEHFDYIQLNLRNFCLKYGAALFYVSVKEDKNCDLLLKYLIHRIYFFPFRTPALVVEKDGVFIPSGWDSEKKISILYENLSTIRPNMSYNEVILKPVSSRKPMPREAEIVAEDDLVFLCKLQNLLNEKVPPSVGRPVSAQETAIRTPPGVQKTADRRLSGSPGVQASPKKIESKHGAVGGEGVLQNFFNSLLNRRTGSPSSPSVRSIADKSAARLDAAVELDRMSGSKKSGFTQSSEPEFGEESEDNSLKNVQS